MNEKELQELVELLVPFIKKELLKDGDFKTNVKRKNAIVTSGGENDAAVDVKLPYDAKSFSVPNKTGEELVDGDLICIEYCIDLKNAIAVYKVN